MSEEKKRSQSGSKIIEFSKVNKNRFLSFTTEDLEDPELDEMTRESFKQEADLLEEELNRDPELMGVGASDDLLLSIVDKLKEQGVWEEAPETEEVNMEESDVDETCETEQKSVESVDNLPEIKESCAKQEDVYRMLSEEDQQALMLGREVARQKEEKKIRRQRQRRNVRRIASVAAVFVVVFMVGMTSEANRRLVLNAWDAVMTMAGFKIDTDYAESEKVVQGRDAEEELAWNDAAERLGISPLAFVYMPEGMVFEQYEVMEESNFAIFMYSQNEKILSIKVMDTKIESSMYYGIDQDAVLKECILIDKNVEAEIWKINSTLEERYMVKFEYNECLYVMSGILSGEEIKKIIKNTIFL